jgi:hypothetical protein
MPTTRLQASLSKADQYRDEGLWRYAAAAYLEAAGDCDNVGERIALVRQAVSCLALYECQQTGLQLSLATQRVREALDADVYRLHVADPRRI